MLQYYLFIGLTAAAIIAQVPNAYYVFRRFSRLSGTLKEIQAIAFCIILSTAIFGFVYIERPDLALLGAVLEVIINIYYYTGDFWERGYDLKKSVKNPVGKQVTRFWRINWIALILIGIGMPTFIYIFSEILVNL
jgi:multisubunit Na+/H+ antiporter MnhB subunit